MSLVHVSGTDHVNPLEVARLEGSFPTLKIIVHMRDGKRYERFVREERIKYRTAPSRPDPAHWSGQQKDFYRRLQGGFFNGEISDFMKTMVASYVPARSEEEAFKLEVAEYAADFK